MEHKNFWERKQRRNYSVLLDEETAYRLSFPLRIFSFLDFPFGDVSPGVISTKSAYDQNRTNVSQSSSLENVRIFKIVDELGPK